MDHRHSRDAVTSRLRLRGYDYSSPNTYFITICTEHRINHFGDVQNGRMELSPAGVVIESWWHSIPGAFVGVELDLMMVMPNHIHGLISLGTDPDQVASASLSDVMGWFKSRTTHDYILSVRTEGWPPFPGKLWQQGFYEHIVRSSKSLSRIQDYILANPSQWLHDEENVDRVDT